MCLRSEATFTISALKPGMCFDLQLAVGEAAGKAAWYMHVYRVRKRMTRPVACLSC